jgi:hypothetical protein
MDAPAPERRMIVPKLRRGVTAALGARSLAAWRSRCPAEDAIISPLSRSRTVVAQLGYAVSDWLRQSLMRQLANRRPQGAMLNFPEAGTVCSTSFADVFYFSTDL